MTTIKTYNDKPLLPIHLLPKSQTMLDVWSDFEKDHEEWDEVHNDFVRWLEWTLCAVMEEECVPVEDIPELIKSDGIALLVPDFYVEHPDGHVEEFDLRTIIN